MWRKQKEKPKVENDKNVIYFVYWLPFTLRFLCARPEAEGGKRRNVFALTTIQRNDVNSSPPSKHPRKERNSYVNFGNFSLQDEVKKTEQIQDEEAT